MRTGLTFDDVVIVPGFSTVKSRDDVSTKTEIMPGIFLDVPIISANMDSITGVAMATAMDRAGGLGILHRFMPEDEIFESVRQLALNRVKYPAFSIGLDTPIDFVSQTVAISGPEDTIVCLDVAHGFHERVLEYILELKDRVDCKLIVGNVATRHAAEILSNRGADLIKVGIGPGSFCTTRVKTGCGVPQFTAIQDCSEFPIIADGGIRVSGDITKALAAGARAVMIGNLLAGTDEAAQPTLYRGMASRSAQLQWKSTNPKYIEGESDRPVGPKGPAGQVIASLMSGVVSGMSYIGAHTLEELREKAEFMQVTPAAYREGLPHGIK